MRSLTGLLLLLLFVPGCSSPGVAPPKLYPVTGNLKVDGKPLEGVTVQLMPADPQSTAQPCSGVSTKEGDFVIRTNGDRGATAGKFKVVLGGAAIVQEGPVSVEEAAKISGAGTRFGGMPKPKYPFPMEWTNPKTTPKTVEVVDQAVVVNIDI